MLCVRKMLFSSCSFSDAVPLGIATSLTRPGLSPPLPSEATDGFHHVAEIGPSPGGSTSSAATTAGISCAEVRLIWVTILLDA